MPTKTVVVKLGGSTLGGGHTSPTTTLTDLMRLLAEGAHVVIVHGGGKAINAMLERLGLKAEFRNGLRVTDLPTLETAMMVMRGQINPALVSEFNKAVQNFEEWPGKIPTAIGLTGLDGDMILAQRETTNGDIGLVGRITEVNLGPILMALEWGFVPIIAPFGVANEQQPEGSNIFNINADNVASHIAAAIQADFCVFLTDVPGILDANKETIIQLDPGAVQELIGSGVISGGMIPKVESALLALNGSKFVAIIDGNQPNALYETVNNYKAAGTLMVNRETLELSLNDYQPESEIELSYIIEPNHYDSAILGEFLEQAYLNTPDYGVEATRHGDFKSNVSAIQTGIYGEYNREASFVLRDNDKIIGATMVTMPQQWQNTALIAQVATDPNYRNQGIARLLLQKTLEALAAQKVAAVRLSVTAGNDAAYNLYINLGFEPLLKPE